jgi:hypothetical protein
MGRRDCYPYHLYQLILIASVPDLVLTNSLSLLVFQSLKAVLSSAALVGLTGLWLARGTTDFVDP